MRRRRSKLSIIRSLLVILAVGVATTGISFAALQGTPVSLTGNTINTGTVDLRISKDGITFTTPSMAGFSFDGVVPGGAAVPAAGNTVYLKNNGNVNIALKAGISTTPLNNSGVDLTKTHLIFTRTDDGGVPVTISVKALIDSYAGGGTNLNDAIAAGTTATYSLKASMDADAYSGASASISNITLVFSGSGA